MTGYPAQTKAGENGKLPTLHHSPRLLIKLSLASHNDNVMRSMK